MKIPGKHQHEYLKVARKFQEWANARHMLQSLALSNASMHQ